MKKILFAISIIMLLAVGCAHTQTSNQNPLNNPITTSAPNQETKSNKPNPINGLLNQSNKMETYLDKDYGFTFSYPASYTFQTPTSTDVNDISFSHQLEVFAPGQEPMYITIRSQPLDVTGKIYSKVDDIVPMYVNSIPRPVVKYTNVSGIRSAYLYWKKDQTNMVLFIYNGFVYEISYKPEYQTLVDSFSLTSNR